MSVTANPYCTLDQVRAALGLTDTSLDGWIAADLLPEAQDQIDDYLGFSYQQDGTTDTPTTRTFSGRGNKRLIIDECLSFSVVSEIDYDAVLNGLFVSGSSITNDITADCVLGPNNVVPGCVLYRISQEEFCTGVNNYQVTGVWGYPAIPAEITRATLRMVIHMLKMKDTAYASQIVQKGNASLKYEKKMPDDVCEILDRKRRIRFASR